jgi:hypothetical protein
MCWRSWRSWRSCPELSWYWLHIHMLLTLGCGVFSTLTSTNQSKQKSAAIAVTITLPMRAEYLPITRFKVLKFWNLKFSSYSPFAISEGTNVALSRRLMQQHTDWIAISLAALANKTGWPKLTVKTFFFWCLFFCRAVCWARQTPNNFALQDM